MGNREKKIDFMIVVPAFMILLKNTNLQNDNKTSYFFNKLAIFNTCISFILILITLHNQDTL